jgi:hypothetical protein
MIRTALIAVTLLTAALPTAEIAARGANIQVRESLLPIEAGSLRSALRTLRADERVRAHALTRSTLILRLELMPEALPGASPSEPRAERCPTVSHRNEAAAECRPRACRLSEFEVRMEIELLTPDWRPTNPLDDEEAALWRAVRTRLQQHEQRHREHAESTAGRLHAQLAERLGRIESIDCLRLRTQLEGLRQAEVQNLRLRDRIFDEISTDTLKLRRGQR